MPPNPPLGSAKDITGVDGAFPFKLARGGPKVAVVAQVNGRLPVVTAGATASLPSINQIFDKSTVPGLARTLPISSWKRAFGKSGFLQGALPEGLPTPDVGIPCARRQYQFLLLLERGFPPRHNPPLSKFDFILGCVWIQGCRSLLPAEEHRSCTGRVLFRKL